MYDLKCKREGCTYNKNCCCTAKEITIDKVAECKSYDPSPDYHKKEKSKLSQRAVKSNTCVNCKAVACVFNNECKCIANGITVATIYNNNCPECCTIKEK